MSLRTCRYWYRSKNGQGYSEFIIIVSLIAIACIGIYTLFGGHVRDGMESLGVELAGRSQNHNNASASSGNGNQTGAGNNGSFSPGQSSNGSGPSQSGNGTSRHGGQSDNGPGSGQGGSGTSQSGGQNGSDSQWPADIPAPIGDLASNGQPSKTCNNPNMVLDPINIFNGNHVESEVDLHFNSPFQGGLTIVRSYNSRDPESSVLGHGWRLNYHVRLDVTHIPVNARKFFDGAQVPDEIGKAGLSETRTSAEGRMQLPLYQIVNESGKRIYFYPQDGQSRKSFRGLYGEQSRLDYDDGRYQWRRTNGTSYVFDVQGKLLYIEDALGHRQRMAYDNNQRLESVTDEATGRLLYFHYKAGKLDHISGPKHQDGPEDIRVRYDYAGSNLAHVTYADHSGFRFFYKDPHDPNNLTRKETLTGHFLAEWKYDAHDRAWQNHTRNGRGGSIDYTQMDDGRVQVTDAYGIVRSYTIAKNRGAKQVTGITPKSGCRTCNQEVVNYAYDNANRIISKEYANGRVDRFDHYDGDRPGLIVYDAGGPNERTIRRSFHPQTGRILAETEASVLGNTPKETIWDFDDDNDATPNEHPTRLFHRKIERGFTLDKTGEVIAVQYITHFDYNAKGQITAIDGPLEGDQDKLTFTYDPDSGNLITATLPLVGTTSFDQYDPAGNLIQMTDSNGVVTTFGYDRRGRIKTVTRDGAVVASRSYTDDGEIETVGDANGRVLAYQYNPAGLVEKIVDPAGNYTYWDYDEHGKVIQQSFFTADGQETLYQGYVYGDPATPGIKPGIPWKALQYDSKAAALLETVFDYDPMGNLQQVTDANANATAYIYDTLNRPQRVEQPGGVVTTFNYDRHGNLNEFIDANDHRTAYQYDDMGRLVKTDSPDNGTTCYCYDAAGNLRFKTWNKETTEYRYDGLGRQTAILYSDPAQNVTLDYDTGRGDYLKGRLARITDAAGTVTYSYDAAGNLVRENETIDDMVYMTRYVYDPAGILRSITYPTGQVIAFQPDAADPSQIGAVTLDGESLASQISYQPFGPAKAMTYGNSLKATRSYDKNYQVVAIDEGNILKRAYARDGVGNVQQITDSLDRTRSQRFNYDELYRLTHAGGIYGTVDFSYDKVGSRQTRIQNGMEQRYATQEGTNRLQSIAGLNIETFQSDHNGNIVSRAAGAATRAGDSVKSGSATYTYRSGTNRLRFVAMGTVDQSTYTYNHFGQRVKKKVGDRTTVYHYDIDGQLIAETDPDGNLVKAYVWLHGQPLAMLDANGSIYYYHNDHLGTPQRMTDSKGKMVWDADYLPFGQADVTLETIGNNLRFAGQYFDRETGLHYNYHRYYDPQIGRYLRADPIGLAGGINPYVYVQNNPLNAIDPFGLTDDPVPGLKVEYIDLPLVKKHLETIARWENLSSHDQDPERAMLKRLEKGKKTRYDFEFWMHERIEADLMKSKYNDVYTNENLAKAHIEALKIRGIMPFEIWHPSVLEKYKEYFPTQWEQYWGECE